MTRPSDTHRPGEHPLSIIRETRRRDPGTSLEPRRRGDVDQPTCTTILRPGYRVGNQLLRPAPAEVAEPLATR